MTSVTEAIEALHGLHPRLIDLSLDRLRLLLVQLSHPECKLPPVIHVAGTNGKGSTCAFLRSMAQASGLSVHVYTSPHLVRFNERIRVAGELVTDQALVDVFHQIEQVNRGAPITVFEVITAAAFTLFAATPADLCVLEVGLGGRGDATNVVQPAVCAITSISLDHRDMLGNTLELIAAEKAGIMKPGVPCVTGHQTREVLSVLDATGPVLARDRDWDVTVTRQGLRYADQQGTVELPFPALPGLHQHDNAGIAVAALRAAQLGITDFGGIARTTWPARLQRLHGRLAQLAPQHEIWLDGGHNPGAASMLASYLAERGPAHLIVGMKLSKDSAEFLRMLLPHAASLWAVAEPGQHEALPVEAIVAASGCVARIGPTVRDALRALPAEPSQVLICGSLYLAGEVLKLDGVELQ